MNKVFLIIKREYISRVRKKSFILLTFLTPLLFSLLIFIPMWLSTTESNGNEHKKILVADETGLYASVFSDEENYQFFYIKASDWLQYNTNEYDFFAFVVISDNLIDKPDSIVIYSKNNINYTDKIIINKQIETFLRNEKLALLGLPNMDNIIRDSEVHLNIDTVNIGDKGEYKVTSTELNMLISIIGAFLIYMFIFMYSSQVMHSVLEEKNNRIVEIIISSVKPTQLMMGKIIATIFVALTQFLCWVFLTIVIVFFISFFTMNGTSLPDFSQHMQNPTIILNFNMAYIIGCFIIFFLLGYLLYASFFAAIGAVIESGADSQQFILPVTIPLIFALYVAIYCFQNPDSPLVFWCSLIPFTSPIVMVARLPFQIPLWELVLSVCILIISFLISIRISAKIYKTGILMYGKKISYKEIFKWLRIQN